MKLSEFKAGKYVQRYHYKSFEPDFINTSWEIDDSEVIFLLSKADKKLGELNAYSTLIPDIDFYIKMLVTKESVLSSRIEGTKTNIDEAVQRIEFIDPEHRDDWQEVQNYIKAMNYALEQLNHLPLSNRLLCNTHAVLLEGVRGRYRQPGEFRRSQNWIGGSSLSDAVFIPPLPESVSGLMSDLEKFLHNDKILLPHLIKIAIAHYQFETIHPFLDGNGRIGRLLITLYLVSNRLLARPTLYLSDFFEKNRSAYYDNLQLARTQNNLAQWLRFFLQGIDITSQKAIDTFQHIIRIKEYSQNILTAMVKRQKKALRLLEYLFSRPVGDIKSVAEFLEADFSTAKRLVDEFVKNNLLTEVTGYKRNRLFVFEEYLRLFK